MPGIKNAMRNAASSVSKTAAGRPSPGVEVADIVIVRVGEHVDIEVDGDLLAFAHEVVVVGEGDVGVVFEVRRG